MVKDAAAFAVLGNDLRRLNAALGSGLSFRVRFVAVPAGRSGLPGSGARGREAGEQVEGVLVVAGEGAARGSAAFPVEMSGPREERLLSLARSLAECAMQLGLGAAIYRVGGAGEDDSRGAPDAARARARELGDSSHRGSNSPPGDVS
jgi:hypothetical protein